MSLLYASCRVMVVATSSDVSATLVGLVESLGCQLAGVARSTDDAIRAVPLLRPDVVLLDVRAEGECDALAVAEEIHVCDQTPVVLVAPDRDPLVLGRIERGGACGCLVEPFERDEAKSLLSLAAQHKGRGDARSPVIASRAGVIVADHNGVVRLANNEAHALVGSERSLVGESPPWVAELCGRAREREFVDQRMDSIGAPPCGLRARVRPLLGLSISGWLIWLEPSTSDAP
ncbi:MAG: hypothetical protein U0269_00290 [Polyangiales bacterium]